MRRSFKKGFTLIELVVVLAIIGVLASILVPSVMGYVKKANRSTDLSTAKTIYNDSSIVITDSEKAEAYAGTKTPAANNFTVTHAKNTETYLLYLVAYKEANENKQWKLYDSSAQDFIDELNKMEPDNIALKFRRLSNGGELENWFICRRADDPNSIEVWAGNSGNKPLFRVWPETDDNYK